MYLDTSSGLLVPKFSSIGPPATQRQCGGLAMVIIAANVMLLDVRVTEQAAKPLLKQTCWRALA